MVAVSCELTLGYWLECWTHDHSSMEIPQSNFLYGGQLPPEQASQENQVETLWLFVT